MMHAFLKSANASNDLAKIVDDFIDGNSFYNDETQLSIEDSQKIKSTVNSILYPCRSKLKTYRKFAVNFFLLGLVSFSFFVALNLKKEKNKAIVDVKSRSLHTVFTNDTVIFKK